LPSNSRVDCFVLLTTLKPPVEDIFDTAVDKGLGTVEETHIFAEVEAGTLKPENLILRAEFLKLNYRLRVFFSEMKFLILRKKNLISRKNS